MKVSKNRTVLIILVVLVVLIVSFYVFTNESDIQQNQSPPPASQTNQQSTNAANPVNQQLEECLETASNSEAQATVIQAARDDCYDKYQ